MTDNKLPKTGMKVAKLLLGGAVIAGLGAATLLHAAPTNSKVQAVEKVELDRYLGVWYEVARKPLSFQNKCDRDVKAIYTLNENGNVVVDNRCVTKDGQTTQSLGEAFVQNPPFNSKLKVSFLPQAIRWLPIGRGDYWVLKIDPNYQTVLVGGPDRKYLWVLSRDPQVDDEVLNEYLQYAQQLGYDLSDLIHTKQTGK